MLNKIYTKDAKRKIFVYLALTVAIIAVFWQVNKFEFVNIDDNIYVIQNVHIQSGFTLKALSWAFTTTYAEFWHPLTWISLMFDYQLYGLHPGGYHLTNLLLHLMSTLLLFWLFHRMTQSVWCSAFVAAFFAIHPLRVESVAWISERKDVLSAFFWMLTLCLYVYYTEKPVMKRYLLVLLCFACGLMSKPMVVTLPVIMILLDYWPLGRFIPGKGNVFLWQIKEKFPLFILSAVISLIAIYVQPHVTVKGWPFPLESRIINALISFVSYLEKTFWPSDLSILYPFSGQFHLWPVLGAVSFIFFISSAAIIAVKRFPYIFVGWFWYVITILPVIGIIPVGNNAMADRYIYLPSIGIGIILAWSFSSMFTNVGLRKKILFPAAVVFLAILSVLTWKQCGYWENGIKLFSHALQLTKDNSDAYAGMGFALFNLGKNEQALDYYNKAIDIKPDFRRYYLDRGVIHAKLGLYELAIADFNKALSLKQNYAEALNNRGITYYKLGQYKLAIEDLNQAIHVKPDYADAYSNRGLIYDKSNQFQRAMENYNKAIAINPNHAPTYVNRGVVYAKNGHYQQAINDFNKAIYLKQDYADAYNYRGYTHLIYGNKKLGCPDVQKACELGNCEAFENTKTKNICH